MAHIEKEGNTYTPYVKYSTEIIRGWAKQITMIITDEEVQKADSFGLCRAFMVYFNSTEGLGKGFFINKDQSLKKEVYLAMKMWQGMKKGYFLIGFRKHDISEIAKFDTPEIVHISEDNTVDIVVSMSAIDITAEGFPANIGYNIAMPYIQIEQ